MKNILYIITCIVIIGIVFCVIQSRKPRYIEDYLITPTDAEYCHLKATLPDAEFLTKLTPSYTSDGEDDAGDIQCPIPKNDRVANYTGIQCVWSSIEMLGRWAEEPKLINPPITSRPNCKSYASPSSASERLNSLNVKFEQTNSNREAGIRLIKKAMDEGRGCLFDVPGHAMVLVHYDENNDVVKWVDNSDTRLAVQTMNISTFNKRWGSWVLVIYADNDIVPAKTGKLARSLPIFENGELKSDIPKDFIQMPQKDKIFPIPQYND